jgi:hypothetical protein
MRAPRARFQIASGNSGARGSPIETLPQEKSWRAALARAGPSIRSQRCTRTGFVSASTTSTSSGAVPRRSSGAST